MIAPSKNQLTALSAKASLGPDAVGVLIDDAKKDLEKATQLIGLLLQCWMDCEARSSKLKPAE